MASQWQLQEENGALMTQCMDVTLHSGGVTSSDDKAVELCTYKNDQALRYVLSQA